MAFKKDKIPLAKALGWIFLSVFLINGSVAFSLYYYKKWKQLRCQDEKYHLVALVAKCTQGQSISHQWLAEKLSLSVDYPTHFDAFRVKEKEKELLQYPIFKKVAVQKIPPGTVFISYHLKEPVAYLADYENTAIDKEGFLFPFKPFFTPKKLPEIRLGNQWEEVWGQKVDNQKLACAFLLLKKLQQMHSLDVLLIDVSRMEVSSAGRCEIIVELDEIRDHKETDALSRSRRILRLSSTAAIDGLNRYEKLLSHFEKQAFFPKGKIIDLRLAHLAYLGS